MRRDGRPIALATRSADKAREIRQLLGGVPAVILLTLDDLGCRPRPEEEHLETFDTFQENAAAKARYFARRTSLPTIADDSGLRVDALGGAPGVRTKRFAGRPDLYGAELDIANNHALLDRLRAVPDARRTARYLCAAVLALPERGTVAAIGTAAGEILDAPRGRGGFGYDPLFLLPDLGLTFAEISAREKNRRSHRGRAFRGLAPHLSGLAARGVRG